MFFSDAGVLNSTTCPECSNLFLISLLVPSPNLYVQLNALQFTLDQKSILWLNQFALDLKQSLNQFMVMYMLNDNSKSEEHVDVRVDGLMIKVQFEKNAAEELLIMILFHIYPVSILSGSLLVLQAYYPHWLL